jgi:hypothetical protein
MSATPDPADLAPSRDPAAYGRRALFTPGFFVWLGLCVACLAVGAAIDRIGLGGAPARPETETTEPAPRPAQPPPASANAVPPASETPARPQDDSALGARLTRLETSSTRENAAATAALAAAALSAAAQGSGPFDQDVAAYERLAPGDPDLRALAPLAARGAPSRAALAAALPELAAQAAALSRAPAAGAGFPSRLWVLIGRVVVIRHIDPGAPGVDGQLTRAQDAAAAGDLPSAVRELDSLPKAARAPLADWLAAARRRIEIDDHIQSLQARALAALAQPAPGSS